jgi:glucosamine kinase
LHPYNAGVSPPAASPRRRPPLPAAAPGWSVGVDLGGSWLRIAALDGKGRGRALTEAAPRAEALPACLKRAWQRWGLRRPAVGALVVASRGVWTRAERRAVASRLRGLARRVEVVSDVEAAYRGALDESPGLLLLAGTGSIALGRSRRGRWERTGGLGPLLGDEGSGFWIGRQWLAASATGGEARHLRRIATAPDAAARIAAIAPRVLRLARQGEPRARAIVAGAQEALALLGIEVARRLRLAAPLEASWAGGLMDDERFRAGVWRAMRRHGTGVRPSAPRETGAAAALRMACDLIAPPSPRSRVGRKWMAHRAAPRSRHQR